jgi:hypothetical protein
MLLDFETQPLIPCFSFIVRALPAVPALAPVKALKLRTSLATKRRSERAPWAAACVAASSGPPHATTAAARPQQEETVAAAAQALVPHDPHQGRGRSRSESRSTRGCEAVEAPTDGDFAPRRGQSRRAVGPASGPAPELLVVRSDGCVMSQ